MTDDEAGALDPEELDYLQARLVGQLEAACCMPLDVAHGFLTAAAGSCGVQDQALLDRVLGGLAGEEKMRRLLVRFRAQLLDDLRSAAYGPLVLQMPRDDGSALPPMAGVRAMWRVWISWVRSSAIVLSSMSRPPACSRQCCLF